jgi:hypothetical protein
MKNKMLVSFARLEQIETKQIPKKKIKTKYILFT